MRTPEEHADCQLDEIPDRLCPPFQEAFKPYLKMTRNMAKCGDGDAGGFGGGAGLGDGGGARFKAMLKRAPKVGADAAWHAHDEPVLKVRCAAQRFGVGEVLGSRGVAASCLFFVRSTRGEKERGRIAQPPLPPFATHSRSAAAVAAVAVAAVAVAAVAVAVAAVAVAAVAVAAVAVAAVAVVAVAVAVAAVAVAVAAVAVAVAAVAGRGGRCCVSASRCTASTSPARRPR